MALAIFMVSGSVFSSVHRSKTHIGIVLPSGSEEALPFATGSNAFTHVGDRVEGVSPSKRAGARRHGQRGQMVEELPPDRPHLGIHVQQLRSPDDDREDGVHGRELFIRILPAPDGLVAVDVVDVVLAVGAPS